MVEIWLPYGKTEVHVSVPLRYLMGTIEPAELKLPENPFETITSALDNLIGTENIQDLVNGKKSAAIALDGTMAPHAASVAASAIVWTLEQNGMSRENVSLIIGNGLREHGNLDLLGALQRAEPLGNVAIHEHSINSVDINKVGVTSSRTQVSLAQPFLEADLRIAVGDLRPDHFSGMKGAQSTVMPALASREGLTRHREISFHGSVTLGIFEGNLAHLDQMEACKMADLDVALNLVTDGWGRIVSAVAGGIEQSWKTAVERSGDLIQLSSEADADIIIVSAGGDLYDFNLFNAVWALQGIASLVKKGATIIFLAECTQGLGAAGLESLAQVDTLSELRRRYELGARAVYAIKSTLRGNNEIILVSALPTYLADPLGFKMERTANAAFQRVMDRRRNRRTLVVTHGASSVFMPSKGGKNDKSGDHHSKVEKNQ
ncbi:MAG: lactate racemase domain-containing protein [Candidatus Bathyarchaeota archaeon]|jgi:nickel-dependent lactate racemase|nr:lactate racemase domain-containing protein [Candidatus Bathyarchaeota archaeon]